MKSPLRNALLVAMCALGLISTPVEGQKTGRPIGTTATHVLVKGEVVKIEPDFFLIKNAEGEELRMYTDNYTRIEGPFKPGDMIQAKVTRQGHAEFIRPVTK